VFFGCFHRFQFRARVSPTDKQSFGRRATSPTHWLMPLFFSVSGVGNAFPMNTVGGCFQKPAMEVSAMARNMCGIQQSVEINKIVPLCH